MRAWLQHNLNDAHIFCRLMCCRVPKPWARWVSKKLAGFLRPLLYGRTNMDGVKPFYKSTSVMGGAAGAAGSLAALVSALAALKGIEIGPESQALIVTLMLTFGGCVAAIVGRIKADLRIGERPGYATGGLVNLGGHLVGAFPHENMASGSSLPAAEIASRLSVPDLADVQNKLVALLAALNAQRPNEQPDQPQDQPTNP